MKAFQERIEVPIASCHASTLARVGEDTLLAWFGGAREGAPDVGIYLARRVGGAWSEPRRVASEEGLPHWNPVLFAEGQNVSLYYKVGRTIPGWHTRVLYSRDGGLSFDGPVELVPGDVGGRGPVRNKLLHLRSGRLLAPASIETQTRWDAFVDILDEGAAGFRKSASVPLWRVDEVPAEAPAPAESVGGRGGDPGRLTRAPFPVRGKGVIQPTLWESDDGCVHMLLRSTEGVVLRSDSADGGETWCAAYSAGLPNNNSGIDLARLQDGRLALALNPVSGDWAARTPLSIYLSKDGGEFFTPLIDLESGPGEYSYPAVLCEGGRLFISHTWNRTHIAYWEIEPDA